MNRAHSLLFISCLTFFLTCENHVDPEIIATIGSTFITKDDFIDAGGSKFMYIPCVNESPLGVEMMTDILLKGLKGWPTEPWTQEILDMKKIQKELALKKGATN